MNNDIKSGIKNATKHKTDYIIGPVSIIQMYRPRDNKRITFMGDFHRVINSCLPSKYKDPDVNVIEWVPWIEKQIATTANSKTSSDKIIDIFFETSLSMVNAQFPDQGRMFNQVIPYFAKQKCLQVDKKECLVHYPNARFHYIDPRRILESEDVLFLKTTIIDKINFSTRSAAENIQLLSKITAISLKDWLRVFDPYQYPAIKKEFQMYPELIPKLYTIINETWKRTGKYFVYDSIQLAADNYPFTSGIPDIVNLYRSIQFIAKSLIKTLQSDNVMTPQALQNLNQLLAQLQMYGDYVVIYGACIMDLYTIGRLLKPYIHDVIILEGQAHVVNQIAALRALDFFVTFENPLYSSLFSNGYQVTIGTQKIALMNQYAVAAVKQPLVSSDRSPIGVSVERSPIEVSNETPYLFYTRSDDKDDRKLHLSKLMPLEPSQCTSAPEDGFETEKNDLYNNLQDSVQSLYTWSLKNDESCAKVFNNGRSCPSEYSFWKDSMVSDLNVDLITESDLLFIDASVLNCMGYCRRNREFNIAMIPKYVVVDEKQKLIANDRFKVIPIKSIQVIFKNNTTLKLENFVATDNVQRKFYQDLNANLLKRFQVDRVVIEPEFKIGDVVAVGIANTYKKEIQFFNDKIIIRSNN